MPTFFINGTSLSDSTAVFLDSEQLTCAPDGYYSDGVIIRQQVGCVLLPFIPCPSCSPPCNNTATATGDEGSYLMSVAVGSGLGAVIIRFDVGGKPDGIIAELNGNYYNELASPILSFGYLAGTPGLPTFIGNISNQGTCPGGSIVGGPYTLNKFQWDGTSFISIPGTDTINVLAGQSQLTAGDPGQCVMVIPKTFASPDTVNVYVYGPCGDTVFDLNIECVALLPSFKASKDVPEIILPSFCELSPISNTYYVVKMNSPAYPYVAEGDLVFQDPYGQTKCVDGFYKTNALPSPWDTIEVSNGIIVNRSNQCP
jgi:hypothetical protein